MPTRSLIREALTRGEINECLRAAFEKLPAADQEIIKGLQNDLIQVRGMGPLSALELMFAVDQAPALARLNETLAKGG